MKKCIRFIFTLGLSLFLTGTVLAEDENISNLPWKKAYLNLGWFISDNNSSFRIGEGNLGLGISIDVEEFLGIDSTDSAFRVDGGWRFTENKRHKLELGWFRINRDSTTTIVEPIEIPPELGGGTIGPGTVNSEFNFDIIKLKYEYSFFLDDRLDLNAGLGAFIMPIEFAVQAIVGGVGSRQLAEDITTATLSTFTPPFPPSDKRVEIQ